MFKDANFCLSQVSHRDLLQLFSNNAQTIDYVSPILEKQFNFLKNYVMF